MVLLTDSSPSPLAASSPDFLPYAYVRGTLIPFAEAQISIATHALHYGTAVLGGIRGFARSPHSCAVFRLDAHCQRLSHSAKYLNVAIAPEAIQSVITEVVRRNAPVSSFYLRPLIYTSSLGIAPRLHNVETDFLIYGMTMVPAWQQAPVRCRISSWQRQDDRSQPLRGKVTATYIASALAKTEAIASGFDEAILMNAQGKISEASGMNIFLVRQGQLITPSVDQAILEGITRHSIFMLAQDLGIPVVERPVDKSELFIADEVFLCGTAAQITPVAQVETYILPDHRPITHALRDRLRLIMDGKDSAYAHWMTDIAYGDRERNTDNFPMMSPTDSEVV